MHFSKLFKLLFAAVFTLIVIPIVSNFFVELAKQWGWYDDPTAFIRRCLEYLSGLAAKSWYPYLVGALAAFLAVAFGNSIKLQIDQSQASSKEVSPERPDTRLKIKLDPNGSRHFLQVYQRNIGHWVQTIFSMSALDGELKIMSEPGSDLHVDTVSIIFDQPVSYERPIVNTAQGAEIKYNVFALGDKGCVLQLTGDKQPKELEIWFPPVGYHEKAGQLELERTGMKVTGE